MAGVDCVGLGSDYNGVSTFPEGMENESSYPLIFQELLRQGNWTEEDLGKLANGNLIRVWKEVEEVRDLLQWEDPLEELIDEVYLKENAECYSFLQEE